jgi:hypothetical protein
VLCSGNLPPETRKEQARLFQDPDSGYNVLVASDAIGRQPFLLTACNGYHDGICEYDSSNTQVQSHPYCVSCEMIRNRDGTELVYSKNRIHHCRKV